MKSHTKGLSTSILFTKYITSGFQQQTKRHAQRQNTQPEETNPASESNSDMVENLELLDQEIKITVISILRVCYNFYKLTVVKWSTGCQW